VDHLDIDALNMLHRPPRRSTPAARKSAAQQRWRRNAAAGKRLARVPVDARVLDWLARHYPGRCNLDDLADVGRLIGEILESSARM
jgi:hypothetical protein